jgi:hypothetical protein
MTRRTNAILRVIEVLDAKIEGLRYAKELLLEQQRTATARTPKAVKSPAAARIPHTDLSGTVAAATTKVG